MTTIRTARPCDACRVGVAMRSRDVSEVQASSGHGPVEALRAALACSTESYTIEHEGTPFAVFGVAPLTPGAGAPWMLATDEFAKHTLFIMRHTRSYLDRWHEDFPVLTNFVDCRNKDSLVYLRAVGFQFTAFDSEFGVERRPFLQFTRVRHV